MRHVDKTNEMLSAGLFAALFKALAVLVSTVCHCFLSSDYFPMSNTTKPVPLPVEFYR